MDTLTITDLELWTRIGVPDEERKAEQRILVTIELSLDLSAVSASDDVTQGINYKTLTNDVRALGKKERKTIERLGEDIAHMILQKYAPHAVKVSVFKQPLPGVKGVTATIARP